MTPVVTDFTYYWFAAHEFVHGANPYTPEPVHNLLMLAPPWVLALLGPFGYLPLRIAEIVWLMISLAARSVSLVWLWQVYAGDRKRPSWAGWLLGAFVPVFMCFVLGQMDLLMLLGVAGFLRFQRSRPFIAGAFLFLAAFKPQIAFLIWPALLLCAAFRAERRALAGFVAAISAASLIVLAHRPAIFLEYWTAYHVRRADFYDTKALLGNGNVPWLLPALALVWLLWRWKTSAWDWRERMPELLLVSAVAAPHIWPSDHVLLIPALIQAMLWLEHSPKHVALYVAGMYCGFNASLAVLIALRQKWWYGWLIFAWVAFYLYAKIAPRFDQKTVSYEEFEDLTPIAEVE